MNTATREMKEPITPTPSNDDGRHWTSGAASHRQQSFVELIILRRTLNLMVADAVIVHRRLVRLGTTSTDQITSVLNQRTKRLSNTSTKPLLSTPALPAPESRNRFTFYDHLCHCLHFKGYFQVPHQSSSTGCSRRECCRTNGRVVLYTNHQPTVSKH